MKDRYTLIVVAVVNASFLLSACSESPKARTATKSEAAKVEKIAGTELNRVILSEKAAQRLDIQTAAVRMETVDLKATGRPHASHNTPDAAKEASTPRLVVPYSAVLYDVNGKTWVYSSPAPLTFVRQPITVEFIDGDRVVLVDGPPEGSVVVTVGAAELYGSDTGVGK